MIRSKGFPLSLSAAYLWTGDANLKAHPAYRAAKAGGKDAALELVLDVAAAWISSLGDRLRPGALYLAKLSSYIQVYGGVVSDVVVLVNAGRDAALVPDKRFVRLIKERFDEKFTEIFGIEPEALTANEAQYLVGFKSVEQIRNRLAAAEQEIDRRLCSKGITRAIGEASSGAFADQDVNASSPGAGDSLP